MGMKKPVEKKRPAKKGPPKGKGKADLDDSCGNRNSRSKLAGGQTVISKLFNPRNSNSRQAAIIDLCDKIKEVGQPTVVCEQSDDCRRARRTCKAAEVEVTASDIDLVEVDFSDIDRKAFAIANNTSAEKTFNTSVTCKCVR